jgi:hypothetical protein
MERSPPPERWVEPVIASNPFAGNTLGIPSTLSVSVLVGFAAFPVNVVVDGCQSRVVEPESGRSIRSIMLDRILSERPIPVHAVNTRTSPLRKRTPARLAARKVYPLSPVSHLM